MATRVLCADPVLREAADAYLNGRPEVEVAGETADVVLVFADAVDLDLRAEVEAVVAEIAAAHDTGTAPRLVLVVEEMEERHLWWAVAHELSAVLARSSASWDEVISAVVTARAGGADLPSATVGWLLDEIRSMDTRLAAVGVNRAGLTTRETEILRLFAAGLETADVARRLNYSERTIKSVVHAVKTRLGLRNRAHAVAHALRIGAI
ncbi:LuxR C-terminal-related transcriptional regulator [Pseudonocardia sp. ICBG1293]|uniref:helix-turn-helix transcriptional regulator n=1 Tax=Pseudonocardia sp. ICBG1293 TaxID=2844382 RepID=UPI001CCA7836|nr:LuxR C-terminal-related transcriptional regulator [Pseudonocardia sp. ICBG1293]